jgi:hypothetical protein
MNERPNLRGSWGRIRVPASLRIVAIAVMLGTASLLARYQHSFAGGATQGIDVQAFQGLAARAPCADRVNRMFAIDGQMVFWDAEGSCSDFAYSFALYGQTPSLKLCSQNDSIGGPQTSCQDDTAMALFGTILKNRGKVDLGLGDGHQVFLVGGATAGIDVNGFRGLAAQVPCSGGGVRLFAVDGLLVLWDQRGCPGTFGYADALYGTGPKNLLCSWNGPPSDPYCSNSTIEAPDQTSERALFQTLVANEDAPDLGLGPEHLVQEFDTTSPAPPQGSGRGG